MLAGKSVMITDVPMMIVMQEWKWINGEERPVFMFFKHGLKEEMV